MGLELAARDETSFEYLEIFDSCLVGSISANREVFDVFDVFDACETPLDSFGLACLESSTFAALDVLELNDFGSTIDSVGREFDDDKIR